MSELLIKAQQQGNIFNQVSAQQAGWDLLNMAALRLSRGQSYGTNVKEHEHVTVVLGGRCRITVNGAQTFELGRRPNVFEGMPHALYLPRRSEFLIEALSEELEVACCWVPTDQDHPIQAVRPADSHIEIRGGGNASRQINSILPPGFDCHRLVCVEVYTPSGNWSSYPPHKHDVHRVDEEGNVLEADLEEIYFYKLDKPDGFAYQRVYGAQRDQLVLARNHDIVLVPDGYHPVVSGPGYTTYYLNFLAGSAQSLANSDDPAHTWVKHQWGAADSRLPLVHHQMEVA